MKFERGQNPKKALDIGARPYEVIPAYLERPDGQKGNIKISKDQLKSIWKKYIKREIYQGFPEKLHIFVFYTKYDGLTDGYSVRLRSLQGKFIEIDGELFRVPFFPGYEYWVDEAAETQLARSIIG